MRTFRQKAPCRVIFRAAFGLHSTTANTAPCAFILQTLYNTCWQYDIHISARHLNRCHNEAADSLSKLNMDRFHEIVPDAAPRAKKLKKLDFLGPLDHLESLGVKNIKSGPSPLDVTL